MVLLGETKVMSLEIIPCKKSLESEPVTEIMPRFVRCVYAIGGIVWSLISNVQAGK